MASKATLKSYFETGKTPTQQQFAELIDATYNESVEQRKMDVSGQTTVTFNHKLGKYPCIIAIARNGLQVKDFQVKHLSITACEVSFSNAFEGIIAAS